MPRLFFVLFGLLGLVAGAATPAKDDGMNARRTALGLRLIGPTWTLYRHEFGATDWKPDPKGASSKRVQWLEWDREPATPQWEEDYYYSGRKYTNPNGDENFEMVTIHYNYGQKLWRLHYVGSDPAITPLAKRIYAQGVTDPTALLADADAILSKLGLKRL